MMNKIQITIVTPNNKFSTAIKDSINDFAKRNPKYHFVVGDIEKMNRNRNVFIVSDNFKFIKSNVINRIAFSKYRPNGNLQTYVYTLDTGCKPISVRDYQAVTAIENEFHDEYVCNQINLELAEYRHIASLYYNSEVVRTRFKGMMKDFNNVLLCMQAELSECGFDFYSAGNPVLVEKMSNFTATEDSEFLYRDETTSHPEVRTKVQYQTLALDTIRNWVQLQYYKMYDIEPDVRDDFDLIEDINVDWCYSRPLFDTSDLSDIRSTAKIDKDYRHACNHGSATFSA